MITVDHIIKKVEKLELGVELLRDGHPIDADELAGFLREYANLLRALPVEYLHVVEWSAMPKNA